MARCKKCKGKLEVRVIEERGKADGDIYHGYCKKCSISWVLDIKVLVGDEVIELEDYVKNTINEGDKG